MRPPVLVAIACLVLLAAVPLRAQSPQSCEDWGTASFLLEAELADIRRCLDAGADPNMRGAGGATPLLREAMDAGRPKVIAALLQAGADPNLREDAGWFPLHYAVIAGNGAAIAALLDGGADPNVRDADGWSPLLYAVTFATDETDFVAPLLQAGADPNAADSNGIAPFSAAAAGGQVDIVTALLDAGAAVDARDGEGRSPLFNAAVYGTSGVAVALLEAGADPNLRDHYGMSALHQAVSSPENTAVVSQLLEAGADPNARDDDGWAPLHWAAADGVVETARLLLAAGADADARNQDGNLPLDLVPRRLQPSALFDLLADGRSGQPIDGRTPDDAGQDAGEALARLVADADPAAGERLFRACRACHSADFGGPNMVGPNLWGIVGRPVATADGFPYSSAMVQHGVVVGEWGLQQLDTYLANPRSEVPGTSMSYRGMDDPADRLNLLAYLVSLSAD